jgi:pimeloyl-ACP methyl ester carboxylesterase
MRATPIILFPGMGVDERLFAAQKKAIPQIVVPPWLTPLTGESLSDYARRFAARVDPGGPCYVGGASFGGFVAMEVARHLEAKACFLIGSARGPEEFPMRVRMWRRMRWLLPFVPFEFLRPLISTLLVLGDDLWRPAMKSFLEQVRGSDAFLLPWSCKALLEWSSPATPRCPVYQIHGKRDHVLPARCTRADVIVRGAGHILSLTHPEEVNRFLIDRIE